MIKNVCKQKKQIIRSVRATDSSFLVTKLRIIHNTLRIDLARLCYKKLKTLSIIKHF